MFVLEEDSSMQRYPSITVLLVRLHLKDKVSNIMNLDPLIRAVQTFVGVEPDGSPGQTTWKAIYAKLTGKTWVEAGPAPAPDIAGIEGFPQAAVSMILEAEGIDQPAKFPGGESGISLGYGCDIGADPKSLEYWRGILT